MKHEVVVAASLVLAALPSCRLVIMGCRVSVFITFLSVVDCGLSVVGFGYRMNLSVVIVCCWLPGVVEC
jgi:hypothetical protein